MIKEIYELGLEKCAGDEAAAKEFTKGFIKEAFDAGGLAQKFVEGGLSNAGKLTAALAFGLGVHGISSAMSSTANMNQRARFEAALKQAIASNEILQHADQAKLKSFAETMFKFAPRVSGDPNLLAHILSSAIHGESMELATIRSLADLEARYQENHKNNLFTPKMYG